MDTQDVEQTVFGACIVWEVFRATGYTLWPVNTGGGCTALMWEAGDGPSDFVIVVHDEYAIPDGLLSSDVEVAIGPRDMPVVERMNLDVGHSSHSRDIKAREVALLVSRTLLDAFGPQ